MARVDGQLGPGLLLTLPVALCFFFFMRKPPSLMTPVALAGIILTLIFLGGNYLPPAVAGEPSATHTEKDHLVAPGDRWVEDLVVGGITVSCSAASLAKGANQLANFACATSSGLYGGYKAIKSYSDHQHILKHRRAEGGITCEWEIVKIMKRTIKPARTEHGRFTAINVWDPVWVNVKVCTNWGNRRAAQIANSRVCASNPNAPVPTATAPPDAAAAPAPAGEAPVPAAAVAPTCGTIPVFYFTPSAPAPAPAPAPVTPAPTPAPAPPPTPTPTAPTNVRATVSGTTVTLTWTAPSNAAAAKITKYEYEPSNRPAEPPSKIKRSYWYTLPGATGSSTSATLVNQRAGANSYKIRAVGRHPQEVQSPRRQTR